jgi:hypothetical protein
VQLLNSKISQLEGESEFYKIQAQKAGGGVSEDAFYFLEFIRSNYLECEAFTSELSIESEHQALIGERMLENCRRGLESCQYLHELLSG